jgi:hypothetical protein
MASELEPDAWKAQRLTMAGIVVDGVQSVFTA